MNNKNCTFMVSASVKQQNAYLCLNNSPALPTTFVTYFIQIVDIQLKMSSKLKKCFILLFSLLLWHTFSISISYVHACHNSRKRCGWKTKFCSTNENFFIFKLNENEHKIMNNESHLIEAQQFVIEEQELSIQDENNFPFDI